MKLFHLIIALRGRTKVNWIHCRWNKQMFHCFETVPSFNQFNVSRFACMSVHLRRFHSWQTSKLNHIFTIQLMTINICELKSWTNELTPHHASSSNYRPIANMPIFCQQLLHNTDKKKKTTCGFNLCIRSESVQCSTLTATSVIFICNCNMYVW
jgi:hypothetical protein